MEIPLSREVMLQQNVLDTTKLRAKDQVSRVGPVHQKIYRFLRKRFKSVHFTKVSRVDSGHQKIHSVARKSQFSPQRILMLEFFYLVNSVLDFI